MNVTAIRFLKVDGEIMTEQNFEGMDINLAIDDVKELKAEGNRPHSARIDFTYMVDYRPKMAKLHLKGYVLMSGEEVSQTASKWQKEKRLERKLTEDLTNLINFNSEINGVLVCKALNLMPPLLSARLEVTEDAKTRK